MRERNRITVVVAEREPAADALREVLCAWAGEGLLTEFLWVRAGKASDGAGATDAERMSASGLQPVRLLDELARSSFTVVRLVCVQLGHASGRAEPESLATAERLEKELSSSLAAAQSLVRVNLMVPATATAELALDRLLPLWDVNLVAAPEDRITDQHADAQVRHPGNYAAHAAVACATAGGLWSQVPEGPFDDRRLPQTGDSAQVLVMRSFVRILRGGGLLDQVLTSAFERRATGSSACAEWVDGVPAADPDALVGRTAASFVTHAGEGELRYRPPRPAPPVRPVTIGLLRSLLMMFQFIFTRLRAHPGEVAARAQERVRSKLEQLVQSATFGQDSMLAATFRGRQPQGEPVMVADAAARARHDAETVLDSMQIQVTPAATPAIWRELRAICFGLVDAGDLPAYAGSVMDGAARQVITRPAHIAAQPSEPPLTLAGLFEPQHASLAPEHPLPDCDPYQAARAMEWLQVKLAQLRGKDERDAVRQAKQRLEQWINERENTLVWRVAEAVGAAMSDAVQALDQNLGRLAEPARDHDDAARQEAQRTLRRTWAVILVFALLCFTAGWSWARAEDDPRNLWILGALAVLLWMVGWLAAFIRFQRTVFQLLYRHRLEVDERTTALRAAEHNGREIVRLGAVYEQLRDWGEIIAWLLHRPEGKMALSGDEAAPFVATPRPYALGLAVGHTTRSSLARVSSIAARTFFRRGWLGSLSVRYIHQTMAELKLALGLDESAPDLDPDVEVAHPKREPILRDLREGRPAEAWLAELRSLLAGQLAEADPQELFPEVAVIARDARPWAATAFLEEVLPTSQEAGAGQLSPQIWTPEARMLAAHRITETMVWSPPGIRKAVDPTVTRPTLSEASGTDTYTMQVIRVDTAAPCRSDALMVFAHYPAGVEVADPGADGERGDGELGTIG
jgi:hypothetical protein